MKIADTAQARKVVQPVKPQPSKQARGVSDFPSANSPTPVLPTTAEKTTTKTATPPKSSTPSTDSSQPMTFEQFLAPMGLTTPEQPSQDEINAMITQALQPILDVYNTQLGQLNQQTQTEKSFDQTSAEQLGNFLSALGDTNYTPTMAALLAQNAQRTSAYNAYQSQQSLWNSLIGGQGGALSQIPDIRQQIESQYAGPSSSDLLSAFSAFNNYNNQLASQALAQQKEGFSENLATTKAQQAQQAIDLTLQKLGISKKQLALKAQNQQFDQWAKTQGVYTSIASTTGIDPRTGKPTPAFQAKLAGMNANAAAKARSNALQTAKLRLAQRKQVWAEAHPSSSRSKLPTANGISKMVDTWRNGTTKNVTTIPRNPDGSPKYVDAYGNPKSVTQTVVTGKLSYTQGYRRLRAMGLSDAKARAYLNSAYPKGTQGRAFLTNAQQATLRASKLPVKVKTTKAANGRKTALLTHVQYLALKAAHRLPKGTLTAEGWYVLA